MSNEGTILALDARARQLMGSVSSRWGMADLVVMGAAIRRLVTANMKMSTDANVRVECTHGRMNERSGMVPRNGKAMGETKDEAELARKEGGT